MKKISLTNNRYGRLLVLSENPLREQRKVRWNCLCDCGETITVRGNSLTGGKTKSCGCLRSEMVRDAAIVRNKKMSGENHPNWNPDKTDEERENGRYGEEYNLWRDKVYSRDFHTCKLCRLSPSGKLVAHHLDGWHWCKDRRLDVDNGVTLCTDCHKDFHNIYGYETNTIEEFLEYYLIRGKR